MVHKTFHNSTFTRVLLVSFEFMTAVEALIEETVGRQEVSSFESSSRIAVESLNPIALKVVESLCCRGLRTRRGIRAELQLLGEAMHS